MKTSGIYSAFTFSIFLHAVIVAAAFTIARHASLYKTPVPYIVTIVDSSVSGGRVISRDMPQADGVKSQTSDSKTPPPKLKDAQKKQDEMTVRERIEALQAKKKIEKMAALRKMVDVKSQESGVKSQESKTQNSKLKTQNSSGGDYYSMVVNKIKQQWIFPESIDKDLLAIITIKIAKDGSVTIDKIEKSSGNPLFDRSALRAISKASPLPPPQQEMEMGVRFRP